MRRILGLVLIPLGVSLTASAQQLTPRDAFWSASDLVSVSANPGAKTKPASASKTASRPRPTSHVAPQLVAENGYGEAPHLVKTTYGSQQLGLRYSLLLKQGDGSYAEALPDATFHDGDRLRLSVMSNEPGYLYVIQQGSSGSWSPIFPVPNSGDSNRVEQGQVYQIPGGDNAFQFDQTAGTEKLFVVLSRSPIQDLDQSIRRLKMPTPAAGQSAPQGETLEAANHIPDAFVQQLASRDLTLVTEQKVDSKSRPNTAGEKAVYVVAKQESGAPVGEVVTRITLNHQ